MYMADVIAFFLSGRFNWIRKTFPERSVIMSLIILISQETVEKLEWAALLWILALAKARSAAPISAAISAKRATQASAKINATLEGARQKGSWPRKRSGLAASLVRYSPLRGCASLAPCHPPFCLYARPTPVFQQSLKSLPIVAASRCTIQR